MKISRADRNVCNFLHNWSFNSDSFHTNAKNEKEDKKLEEKKVEIKINKENIEDFSTFKFNKIE